MRVILVAALAAAACGPNAGLGDSDGDDTDAGAGGIDADPFRPDAPPPAENASVYAHSSTTLYEIDPDTLNVTMVGAFAWPSSVLSDQMTDIAIDKDGNMVGISYSRVYSVDKETAQTTLLSDSLTGNFNGLSFVPGVGPDPNAPERLVGANQSGEVYEIDPATGGTTQVGAYGGSWGSSGDIVSVRGFGTVATVENGGTDQLARLDPSTFEATIIGDTGVNDIWGVGFWENQVFGFTDGQRFVLIDTTNGTATEIETSGVNWWGAAVTTSAPVVE